MNTCYIHVFYADQIKDPGIKEFPGSYSYTSVYKPSDSEELPEGLFGLEERGTKSMSLEFKAEIIHSSSSERPTVVIPPSGCLIQINLRNKTKTSDQR
jgi:hypothetical protein